MDQAVRRWNTKKPGWSLLTAWHFDRVYITSVLEGAPGNAADTTTINTDAFLLQRVRRDGTAGKTRVALVLAFRGTEVRCSAVSRAAGDVP